jgi:hypothetical protein
VLGLSLSCWLLLPPYQAKMGTLNQLQLCNQVLLPQQLMADASCCADAHCQQIDDAR